jgi:membrane-associated phospholipid phosphatase
MSVRRPGLHPLAERLLLVGAVTAFYLLYLPISRGMEGVDAHHPATWVDHALPADARWMYVYFAVMVSGFTPGLTVASRGLFRRIALAYFLVQAVAFGVFLVWPVVMDLRPEVPVTSFHTWGLAVCYRIDPPGTCFPSIHVSLAVLAALCSWKADRLVGGAAVVLGVFIAFSTLMVKQHYLVDVLGGFVLAAVTWSVVVAPWRPPPGERVALPRWAPALLLAVYGLAVLVLYGIYRGSQAT